MAPALWVVESEGAAPNYSGGRRVVAAVRWGDVPV